MSENARNILAGLVVAAVLHGLLLEGAIETFLRGSPAGPATLAFVSLYSVVVVAVMWRGRAFRDRIGSWGWAAASGFVLLGLMTVAAWMPEGLVTGVAVLSQPISALMTIMAAVACALALAMVVRLRLVSVWFRLVTGTLAVYGLVACLIGLSEGIPFDELVRGKSIWQALPFWMQGVFVGALVAVPLTITASVVGARRRARLAEGGPWGFRKMVALALCFTAAIPWNLTSGRIPYAIGEPGGSHRSAPDLTRTLTGKYRDLLAALGKDDATKPSPQGIADGLDDLFSAATESLRVLPRTTFDVGAIVTEIGRDPVKLFEWVRDETRLIPYRGLLRGSRGVLLDRLGNSLDRALLLHALLSHAGLQARLARGMLTAEQARDLLERTRATWNDRTGSAARGAGSALPSSSEDDQVVQALRSVAEERQRIGEEVRSRVKTQADQLLNTIHPRSTGLADANRQAEALREHWWVECQAGGLELVLDPTLPDSAPGHRITDTGVVLQPQELIQRDPSVGHALRLQVVLEVLSGGNRKEVEVLDHKMLPAELKEHSFLLRFHPVSWPRDLNILTEQKPLDTFTKTAVAQREWLPVLSIDGRTVARYSFNDRGELTDTTQPPLAQGAHDLGQSIGGLLGGGSKGTSPSPSSSGVRVDQQVTALWLDYTVQAPDQPARTTRREVFDLIGPARRASNQLSSEGVTDFKKQDRALALLGEIHVLPVVSGLSPEFVRHLVLRNFMSNRDPLRASYVSLARGDLQALAKSAPQIQSLPWSLYDLAIARHAWSPVQADVYLDSVNVFSLHKRPCANSLQQVLMCQDIDIVANDVAVAERQGVDAFATRLVQGVTDTNAEAVVLSNGRSVENTGEIAVRAEGEGVGWVAVTSAQQAMAVAGTEDVRERMKQDVNAGHVVVTLDGAVSIDGRTAIGWWRLNPNTGSVLGIGRYGGGQASMEKAFTIAYVTTWVVGVISFIGCVGMEGTFSNPKGVACATCAIIDGVAMGSVVYAILVAAPGAVLAGSTRGAAGRAAAITFGCQLLGAFTY